MSGDLPRLPQPRLPQPRRRTSSDADSATYGALMGLAIVGIGFLGIVLIVLPFRGLGLLLLGGVSFFGIHYVLWGRLLTRIREEEVEAEQQRRDQ